MRFTPHYVSIEQCQDIHGAAVVLDVLRAFTTAAWSFQQGAERIVLSDDLDAALAMKARFPGALAMKDSRPMPGFELSNSPVEVQVHDLAGRTIIQKTTHGTMGAVAARHARPLYCASFLVASATAAALRDAGCDEAWFVITGLGGTADEDLACAEYIAELMTDPGADATPYLARVAGSVTAAELAQRVADGIPGVHRGDLAATLEVDCFPFAMRASEEDGLLVLRAYNRRDD